MIYILLSAAIIVADQLMKGWIIDNVAIGTEIVLIPGVIKMTHVQNTGAAFSLFQGIQPVIIVITSLFCAGAVLALVSKSIKSNVANIALAMVLGGAVGNLIDRIHSGYVVDMFEFIFIRFAVFNIADIFITAGAILFCLFIMFFSSYESSAGVPSILDTKDDIIDTEALKAQDTLIITSDSDEKHAEGDCGAGKETDYDPDNSGA